MKTVNRSSTSRGLPLRLTILALCSALLLPGIAMAKKPVVSPAGCVMFPPAIYTGFPFTVKVVRDPSYTGVWSQPTVDVAAVFTTSDGGEITQTFSQTMAQYGVTYINATLQAPSNLRCDDSGSCAEVGIDGVASISAVVTEPINKGKKTRVTVCNTLDATVNMSN